MACHQANQAYCVALGDYSQSHWDFAPEWQRQSIINGVLFHARHQHARASASHENWLAEKLAAGWTYGPVKDEVARTHPCCRPFHELPAEQQAKDHLFAGICRALLPLAEDLPPDVRPYSWPIELKFEEPSQDVVKEAYGLYIDHRTDFLRQFMDSDHAKRAEHAAEVRVDLDGERHEMTLAQFCAAIRAVTSASDREMDFGDTMPATHVDDWRPLEVSTAPAADDGIVDRG